MKAIRMHRNGGPAVLKWEEVETPKPKRGQFLIKITTAGVNPVDTKIREGTVKLFQAKLPAIIGRDVAGIVHAVGGGGGAPLKVGSPVFGMLDYDRGAYAQYAVATGRELALRPAGLAQQVAGALGVAALTAWQGLFDHGRLKRGQRVLIHGAAGGVGHLAVQFAKARGAVVIATASRRDLAWVRSLGADQVIDFKAERFEEKTGSINLVFDLIGGEIQDRSWQVLKPEGGALVSTLQDPSPIQAKKMKARAARMVVMANRRELGQIARLIVAKKVRVKISAVVPLVLARKAHEKLEKGHFRGKVVLRVP